jgi:hypothetical protein
LKLLTSIVKYGLVGIIVLVAGIPLISSATSTAVAFRYGNVIPVIIVCVVAVVLMRLSGIGHRESVGNIMLNVVAWVTVVYLSLILFLSTIYMGLLVALVTCALTISGFQIISDPSGIIHRIKSIGIVLSLLYREIQKARDPTKTVSIGIRKDLTSVKIPNQSMAKVVNIIEEFPDLDLSVTRYADIFVLFVPKAEHRRLLGILEEDGVVGVSQSSDDFTREHLVSLRVKERSGLKMSNYCVARDGAAVKRLLRNWPVHATLVADRWGLAVIVRNEDARGLIVDQLPWWSEDMILVGRDSSLLSTVKGVVH